MGRRAAFWTELRVIEWASYRHAPQRLSRSAGSRHRSVGNPFRAIGIDPKGTAAIDWGVYGIPESFLVGEDGTILYKQVGPFTDDAVKNRLLPKIEEALAKS